MLCPDVKRYIVLGGEIYVISQISRQRIGGATVDGCRVLKGEI
jgi:hypothetical protein